MYDKEQKQGVHKRYLPEPNPQNVELARDATLLDVFRKAKELYFSEVKTDINSLCLANSGGVLIPVQSKDSWSLSSFYQKNRLQLSRYKLYVAVSEEVSLLSSLLNFTSFVTLAVFHIRVHYRIICICMVKLLGC